MLRRPSIARRVVPPLLITVVRHRSSAVVGSILDALQDLRLVVLPRAREFFDALLGRVDSLRDSLRVARLSTAIWSALT